MIVPSLNKTGPLAMASSRYADFYCAGSALNLILINKGQRSFGDCGFQLPYQNYSRPGSYERFSLSQN